VHPSVLPNVPDAAGLVATILQEAETRFLRGNGVAAESFLDLIRQPTKSPADTWLALSRLHFGEGDFAAAGRTCGYAAAYRPKDAALQAQLALICLRLGEIHSFEIHLARALRLDAENPAALQLLADLNRDHGRPHDAVWCYRKLLARNPRQAGNLLSLARCLCHLGHADEAIAVLQRVSQLTPFVGSVTSEPPPHGAIPRF